MNAADAAKKVAKDYMGLDTLELQNRDSLDFKSFNVAEIKAALVAAFRLGQQTPEPQRRWYCFDAHDSFGPHDTPAEAAAQLESLANDGLKGLHMVQMTAAEFLEYCNTGRFPFAK